MIMKTKYILLVLIFSLCISFSSDHWEKALGSTIGTVPIMFSGNLIVGTYDGTVFSLNINNGEQAWKRSGLGNEISTIESFNNRLLVIMENGTIYTLKNYGDIEKVNNLSSQVYGAEVSEDKVYITTRNGIVTYDGTETEWIYINEASYSSPTIYNNRIIVGIDEKLTSLTLNGEVMWETTLGPFWDNKPIIYANRIYVGSMNGYMYAINSQNGEESWKFGTSGAITSSALVHGGTVYFGSNDGYLYAADPSDGKLKWEGKTNGGIFSTPEVATIGTENVVLIGSSDSYVYGFKRNNGELIWGYSAVKPVNEIKVYGNQIFAVSDYYIYSVSTERSCIITEPSDRTKIGYKEVEIKGKIFSEHSGAGGLISVNGGPWENIEVDNNGAFNYTLDPNNYFFGSVEVQCKVVDNAGQSENVATLLLIRSTEFDEPVFELEYPEKIMEGGELIIYVKDEETGESVNNFNYKLYGETAIGSRNVTFNAGSAGEVELTFSKSGYDSKTITIIVEQDFTLYIVGGVVLIIVLGIVWFKFLRKKNYEE